jgi:hypothetical protein
MELAITTYCVIVSVSKSLSLRKYSGSLQMLRVETDAEVFRINNRQSIPKTARPVGKQTT